MKLIKNNFLENASEEVLKEIILKNQKEVDLLNKYNDLARKVLQKYTSIPAIGVNLYLLPAFLEICRLYNTGVFLLEKGYNTILEGIMRNMMELVFQMLYVIDDEKNMYNLEKYMYSQTQKKLSYIKEKQLFDIIPKDKLDSRNQELENKKQALKNIGAKNLPPIKDLCEKLGLEYEYAYYQSLCESTHYEYGTIYTQNKFKSDGVELSIEGNYTNFSNDSLRLMSIFDAVMKVMIEKYFQELKNEYETINNEAFPQQKS